MTEVNYSKWLLNPNGNILGVIGNFCMNDLLCFIQDYYIEHNDTGNMPKFIELTKDQQNYLLSQTIVEGGIKMNGLDLSEIDTTYGILKVKLRK